MPVTLNAEDRFTNIPPAVAATTLTLILRVWVNVPDVPVTVTTPLPAVAELPTVRIRLAVPPELTGLNDAVTFFGMLVVAKLTVPLKLPSEPRVMVIGPLPPCGKVIEAGEAVRVKSGTTITNPIGAVWTRLPDVPVIVTVVDALATVEAAVKVTVLVPDVLAGLNEAVTPFGRPVAARLTLLPNPLTGVTVRVLVSLAPGVKLTLVGDAARLKFGTTTVRPIVAVLFRVPEVPVTVTVSVAAAAVLAATNVSVLPVAVLAGLKLAVTPFGRADSVKLTLPPKPFCPVTVRVLEPLLPLIKLSVLADANRVNVGTVTVTPIEAVLFTTP